MQRTKLDLWSRGPRAAIDWTETSFTIFAAQWNPDRICSLTFWSQVCHPWSPDTMWDLPLIFYSWVSGPWGTQVWSALWRSNLGSGSGTHGIHDPISRLAHPGLSASAPPSPPTWSQTQDLALWLSHLGLTPRRGLPMTFCFWVWQGLTSNIPFLGLWHPQNPWPPCLGPERARSPLSSAPPVPSASPGSHGHPGTPSGTHPPLLSFPLIGLSLNQPSLFSDWCDCFLSESYPVSVPHEVYDCLCVLIGW